ncbi:MAG: DUF58 domain-containing protein [Bacilli bacterium]|nr:DUF58 domain-containing protein [Bacilli bacterium]
MKMEHINRIKGNVSIYASQKTRSILDGSYKSIFKGKSLNFDDLREYVIGDNVKDIDWKASARSDNILVKQYVAERKHNILFVVDSTINMQGATLFNELKSEVALYTAGTIATLANNSGDLFAFVYGKGDGVKYFPFKEKLSSIEIALTSYENDCKNENKLNMNDLMDYVIKNINKRMVIFLITDLLGVSNLDFDKIKTLSYQNDLLIFNVSDTLLTGDRIYSLDNQRYLSKLFLNDKKLCEEERKERDRVYLSMKQELLKYMIQMVTIDKYEDIVMKSIELLERHRYARSR